MSFTNMYLRRFSLELEMAVMMLTFPVNIQMKIRHVDMLSFSMNSG
jgi:hypothetical protein